MPVGEVLMGVAFHRKRGFDLRPEDQPPCPDLFSPCPLFLFPRRTLQLLIIGDAQTLVLVKSRPLAKQGDPA